MCSLLYKRSFLLRTALVVNLCPQEQMNQLFIEPVRTKVRPVMVLFSVPFFSGLARFNTFKKSAVFARILECIYALEHLM